MDRTVARSSSVLHSSILLPISDRMAGVASLSFAFHTSSTERSQVSARRRRRAFSASSGGGESVPKPLPARAARHAAL